MEIWESWTPVVLAAPTEKRSAPWPERRFAGQSTPEAPTHPSTVGRPRQRARNLVWRAGVSLLSLALLTSCSHGPLLHGVSVEPPEISPNGDGTADVARITYAVGSPARVTVTLTGPDGSDREHVVRDALTRTPGVVYELLFGGVVQGAMLPAGTYRVGVQAVSDDDGQAHTATGVLTIVDPDIEAPDLEGFDVLPRRFSPNQDGIGDRVKISYRLEEQADVRLWLETADGGYVTDILSEVGMADDPGAPGPHVIDFDAGVDADAPPPPNGEYTVVGTATDAVGNRAEHRAPLTIEMAGMPRAALVGDVGWSASVLPLGSTLVFTATVRNVGDTPLRTRGPEPGFRYDNSDSINQRTEYRLLVLARHDTERAVGLVPHRAAQGLADGEPPTGGIASEGGSETANTANGATVSDQSLMLSQPDTLVARRLSETFGEGTSCVAVVDHNGMPVPNAEVYAFEGDGDGGRRVLAGPDGRACFEELESPPVHELTYARSSGSLRLALTHDSIDSNIAYPFRWQLGRIHEIDVCSPSADQDREAARYYLCLLPGREVTVTGGVRFVEPTLAQSFAVYLALQHEDVRQMHGPYGAHRLSLDFDS